MRKCLSTSIFYIQVVESVVFKKAISGQASIKCRDLVCNVELPPFKNCKDLTMKLEVRYLFSTLSSGANFFIYQLPDGLEIRKILAHGIRMQNNSQTREEIFWIFTDFHGVIQVQSPTCTPAQKFHQWRR